MKQAGVMHTCTPLTNTAMGMPTVWHAYYWRMPDICQAFYSAFLNTCFLSVFLPYGTFVAPFTQTLFLCPFLLLLIISDM